MTLRVFIGFFGIVRSLPYTIESIEQCIFDPLTEAGATLVRGAHFNVPEHVHSPRSEEYMIPHRLPDLERLKLDARIVEHQDKALVSRYSETIMNMPLRNERDDEGIIRQNALFQLHSLKSLCKIFDDYQSDYFDFSIILRSDLRYVDKLPVTKLISDLNVNCSSPGSLSRKIRRRLRSPRDIIMPGWHKAHGLNDRFAIATPIAAKKYMNRIDDLSEYSRSHREFQSELFLKFSIERSGLNAGDTWVRADRIRATGRVEKRDVRPRESWVATATRPLRAAFQI
jgi:hypothetical protein